MRPLGALVFGRIGDIVGRKNTFLATMAIMGASTFLIGLLPGYAVIGIAAPVLLVLLRMLQGLSIGGEYGGASVYVAEHSPPHRRGLDTSWLNATAPAGLVLALALIIACRLILSEADFAAWGWRLPFLVSIVLLGISLWIRLQLEESPVFARMKAEGAIAKAPYAEAFGQWKHMKHVLAVFGWIAGTTSFFYAAHFQSLYFLQRTLKVEALTANVLVMIALILAIPTYLLWGWLSDRYGRKLFLAGGTAIAALTLVSSLSLAHGRGEPGAGGGSAQRAGRGHRRSSDVRVLVRPHRHAPFRHARLRHRALVPVARGRELQRASRRRRAQARRSASARMCCPHPIRAG